jgi:hypothetical protein
MSCESIGLNTGSPEPIAKGVTSTLWLALFACQGKAQPQVTQGSRRANITNLRNIGNLLRGIGCLYLKFYGGVSCSLRCTTAGNQPYFVVSAKALDTLNFLAGLQSWLASAAPGVEKIVPFSAQHIVRSGLLLNHHCRLVSN